MATARVAICITGGLMIGVGVGLIQHRTRMKTAIAAALIAFGARLMDISDLTF